MFNRKFSSNIRRKKRMITSAIILLVVFLSTGYAVFTTNLGISGTLNVSKYDQTLYGVLEKAVSKGYAREYTGTHQDSMAGVGSKKIYHWYAPTGTAGNDLATEILDKNNVIFADHCWQMVRTTDTGGVKMIYNGEVENGKCLNTRENHVGYENATDQNLASNYWYGTDYTYDSVNKTFKISGTTEQVIWNETTGPGLIGKYTCELTNEEESCSTLYLVESYYDELRASVILLSSDAKYSTIGALHFNEKYKSPNYVGYMYGDDYTTSYTKSTLDQSFTATQTMLLSGLLGTSLWYADSIDYGTITENKYSLINPYQVTGTADYPNLVGKYTLRSSNQTSSLNNAYYIAAVDNTTMYYQSLRNGYLLSAYEPIVFGDSITDNGDGTYKINNPISVTLSDWYLNYDSYKEKYTCSNSSTTCANPRYTTTTTPTNYTYLNAIEKIMIGKTRSGTTLTDTLLVRKDEWYNNYNNYSNYKYTCNTDSATCTESTLQMITEFSATAYQYAPNHYYGSSVTWDGANYTLVDPIEIENYNNLNNISTHHYMCVSNGLKICSTVAYIYYYTGSGTMYYITLEDGVTMVSKALEDMFTKNTTNSTVKSSIDAWYKHYMLNYDEYIEDTIFCNDRSIVSLGGWNPNGGITNKQLQFKEYNITSDLSCANITDRFSISNNNAKLTYKVGLISSPEANISGNSKIRTTGRYYWFISPYYFYELNAYGSSVSVTGSIVPNNVRFSIFGVRPVISLKPGTEYVSGTGSMADPYIVDVPMATLTINYRTLGGTVLHEPYVETMPVGANYSITSPTIQGYEPAEPVVSGTMNANGRTATVTYVESLPGPGGPGTDA